MSNLHTKYIFITIPNTFTELEKKQHQQKNIQIHFYLQLETYLSLHEQSRAQGIKAAIGAQINLYIANEFEEDGSNASGKVTSATSNKDHLNNVALFAHLVTG